MFDYEMHHYRSDDFIDALLDALTAEVVTSWLALYSTSKAHRTLVHSLYDGLTRWKPDWADTGVTLTTTEVRVIACYFIPLLDNMTAK